MIRSERDILKRLSHSQAKMGQGSLFCGKTASANSPNCLSPEPVWRGLNESGKVCRGLTRLTFQINFENHGHRVLQTPNFFWNQGCKIISCNSMHITDDADEQWHIVATLPDTFLCTRTSLSLRRPSVLPLPWEQTVAFTWKWLEKTMKPWDPCRFPRSWLLWPRKRTPNSSFLANR